jgi:hypothetical protein
MALAGVNRQQQQQQQQQVQGLNQSMYKRCKIKNNSFFLKFTFAFIFLF